MKCNFFATDEFFTEIVLIDVFAFHIKVDNEFGKNRVRNKKEELHKCLNKEFQALSCSGLVVLWVREKGQKAGVD